MLQRNFSLRAAWDRLDQAAALARKAGADFDPAVVDAFTKVLQASGLELRAPS